MLFLVGSAQLYMTSGSCTAWGQQDCDTIQASGFDQPSAPTMGKASGSPPESTPALRLRAPALRRPSGRARALHGKKRRCAGQESGRAFWGVGIGLHEDAAAVAVFGPSFSHQLAITGADGVGVNSEAARPLACAGQVFAGLEVARQDGKLHLGDKLAIDGDLAVRGKPQPHVSSRRQQRQLYFPQSNSHRGPG